MKNKTFKILSDYRTFIMGIAMLSILFFHYTEDCMNGHHMYVGFIKLYKQYIGSVGVDIFLLLSGLGMFYSLSKSEKIVDFYKKRGLKIVIPYILICLPAIIWICIKGNLETSYIFKEFFFINLLEGKSVWFWYIIFMLFCYFISPIIYEHIKSSKTRNDVSSKILVLCIGISFLNLLLMQYSPLLFKRYNVMLLRFMPFFAGFYLGYLSYKKEKIKITDILLLVIGLVFIKTSNNPNGIINRYSKFFWVISLIILAVTLISKFDKNKIVQFIKKIVEFFGKYSLEIYLIHVSARKILNTYQLYTYQIQYYLVYIGVAIIFAPLINKLAKLIEDKISMIGKKGIVSEN